MVRGLTVILGIGLGILWLVGLGNPYSSAWLTWLDGVAALCAFVIAASVNPDLTAGTRAGGPIALSIGIFALWIAALLSNVVPWQTWWNFAFACAFFLTGVFGSGRRTRVAAPGASSEIDRARDRFRKGA